MCSSDLAQPLLPEGDGLFLLLQNGLQIRVEPRLGQIQQQQPLAVLRHPAPELDDEVGLGPAAQDLLGS